MKEYTVHQYPCVFSDNEAILQKAKTGVGQSGPDQADRKLGQDGPCITLGQIMLYNTCTKYMCPKI